MPRPRSPLNPLAPLAPGASLAPRASRAAAPLVAALLAAACGDEPAPPPVGPIEATVLHYDYAFDLDTRRAHARIEARVDVAGDCLALPFRATDLGPTALIDGAPMKRGSLTGGVLTLCGPGHAAGATMALEVDATIPLATLQDSQVGYSVRKDSEQNTFYYLVSWVGGCDQFGPCDRRPDRFATYAFHVTHPATHQVRCPGKITEVSPTETTCDFDLPGGPTYSTFGVAAYPAWTVTDAGSWGPVRVSIHDRASTGIAAAIDGPYHAGFLSWMTDRFGPYPFGDELRILTAPTYWSGFEHPGNIVLDDGLAKTRSSYLHPVAHVLDHELAHQWAGDQTTLADTYDFVWKEAMAEYLAFAYEAEVDPAAARQTANAWVGFASGAAYFPVPADKPALFDYYGDVYGAGPMVLFRQLEVLSSRAAVLDAIATVLGQPRALSVDDLVAALASTTGLDLTGYAAAWIHGAGAPAWPRFQLTFTPGTGATSTLVVHQTNQAEAGGRRCKFHVALVAADPATTAKVEVDTFRGGPDQTLEVPTPPFPVDHVVLDPDHECLAYPATLARPPRQDPWRAR